MTTKSDNYVSRKTVAMAFTTFALSVFALLLWGRIKLVAGVPRTAYAIPKSALPPPPPQTPATKVNAQVPAGRPDLQGD